MTKTFQILPDLTCPELAGYKLPEVERRQEDSVEKMAKDTTKKYVNEREKQTAFLEFISGYTKAREKFIFPMGTIYKIREVLCNGIATNMSLASAIVEFDKIVYDQLAPRNPIAIEVEVEWKENTTEDLGECLYPLLNLDGTVKVVKWIFNE